MNEALRMRIADEIAGIVVGEGYYSMTIGITAALEVADALISAGVVAEEPEWEYGVRLHPNAEYLPAPEHNSVANAIVPTTPHRTLEDARRMAALNPQYRPSYHRRRKASVWVPIQEGAGHEGDS
jgi:hypothetical protein